MDDETIAPKKPKVLFTIELNDGTILEAFEGNLPCKLLDKFRAGLRNSLVKDEQPT